MKRILIVDDNTESLYFMDALLKGNGFDVITATNGSEALESALRMPPDLIISDILMPVMDGFSLCRKWKADEQLKHIPFIFYTATYNEPKDEKFALSLGADRFILKPQEPETLINMLAELFEEKHTVKLTSTNPLGEEMEFFRQHNEILFKKLEKKMLDLEIANQKLKILEEQYRLSFENVTDVIYTIDTDLNLLSISSSVERMLGYKPGDFIGRPVSDFGNILTPESFEQAIADISLVLKGEIIPARIYRFIAKNGNIKYGEVSGSPIMREGKVFGIISVARDITDRKQAEASLLKSEEKFRTIFDGASDGILIADVITKKFLMGNTAICSMLGYTKEDIKSLTLYNIHSPKDISHVIDEFEKQAKGEKVLAEDLPVLRKDGSIFYADISSAFTTIEGIHCLVGIFRDNTERKQAEKALKETLESLRKAFATIIQVMMSAVEIKDPYTAGHQTRSADLARAIATEMGFTQDRIDGIRMAGSIHDIGKLSIPAEILSKPTKLTEIEFSLIKEHSQRGYDILKDVESPWPLAQIVYQHHERMNGSGYPRNLKGDNILMEARIMAVADVVEAMASYRPYRPALGIDAALEEIEKNRGTLYDNAVADTCLRLFREKGYHLNFSSTA